MKKTMTETTRYRKLLEAILDWDSDCCHYDDEKETEVIDGTEEDIYNAIMKDDELHLLGTEKIKATIHLYYTDWPTFSAICIVFKAH